MAETVENCIFDKVDGTVYPESILKCRGDLFIYNVPYNTKVPYLIGKFICIRKLYLKKDLCLAHCPTNCDNFNG